MCKENEGDILNKSVLYLSPLLHVLLSFTAKAGEQLPRMLQRFVWENRGVSNLDSAYIETVVRWYEEVKSLLERISHRSEPNTLYNIHIPVLFANQETRNLIFQYKRNEVKSCFEKTSRLLFLLPSHRFSTLRRRPSFPCHHLKEASYLPLSPRLEGKQKQVTHQ